LNQPASPKVVLRDGPTVDVEAIRLAIDLEDRGLILTKRDHELLVTIGHHLTEAEREAIRRLKPDLLALVQYEAPKLL